MGYTTDFDGRFKLSRPLDDETYNYLVKFNETRRMKRKLGPEYGVEGEFFVDGGGVFGQDHEECVVSYNNPPSTQPGLWCQWRPSKDRNHIEWDGGEKFYDYESWLEYIIKNFLAPKDYVLNGEVYWQGEDPEDRGILVVTNNKVTTKIGRTVYEEEE